MSVLGSGDVHCFLMQEPEQQRFLCFLWRSVSAVEGILYPKDWFNSEEFVPSLPLQISADMVITPRP